MRRKAKPVNVARERYKRESRVRRAMGKPLRPYNELVEEYLCKTPTLENLWRFERELKRRSKAGPQEEERAAATRREYIARFLLGKNDALFLLKMYETGYEHMDAFIQKQIQNISQRRKISQKEAANTLVDYVQKLRQRLEKRKGKLTESSWNLKAIEEEPEKSGEVRHDFLGQALQTFEFRPQAFLDKVKKYQ